MKRWRIVTIDDRKFRWIAGMMFTAIREKKTEQRQDDLLQAILETPNGLLNSDLSIEMHREYIRGAIGQHLACQPRGPVICVKCKGKGSISDPHSPGGMERYPCPDCRVKVVNPTPALIKKKPRQGKPRAKNNVPMLCCHTCAKAIKPLAEATTEEKTRLRICDECQLNGTAQYTPADLAKPGTTARALKSRKSKAKQTPMLHCEKCSEPIKPLAEASRAERGKPAICEDCKNKKRGSKK